jgi:hypothetical protein
MRIEREYRLHLFWLGFDLLSGKYATKIFNVMVQYDDLATLNLTPASRNLVSTGLIFKR